MLSNVDTDDKKCHKFREEILHSMTLGAIKYTIGFGWVNNKVNGLDQRIPQQKVVVKKVSSLSSIIEPEARWRTGSSGRRADPPKIRQLISLTC